MKPFFNLCLYIAFFLSSFFCGLFFPSFVFAQNPSLPTSIGQIGKIDLAGVALLSVPNGFVFMEGNSFTSPYSTCEETEYLGCLVSVPTNSSDSLAQIPIIIELTYTQTGHIADTTIHQTSEDFFWNDILQINYRKNKSIKEKHCDTLVIQSWAMKPYFLEAQHQLQWAVLCNSKNKNYVRHSTHKLGRHGIIEMNIRTSSKHLLAISPKILALTSSIEFYKGFRHEDFDPNFDNLAAFGFAGILAGKVLTKAKVAPFIFKWLKWVIIALLGLFTYFKRKLAKQDLETDLEINYLEPNLQKAE